MRAAETDALRESHQAAVADYLAAASALPPAQWDAPADPGQWSPAQVTEHLRLSYEVLLGELHGGRGFRLRSPAWLRPFLRLRYLRAILTSGRFPRGVRAPSEVRPGPGPFPKSELLEALREAAARFETELLTRDDGRARLTHHVFGTLSSRQTLRLVTVHAAHHRSQLPVP